MNIDGEQRRHGKTLSRAELDKVEFVKKFNPLYSNQDMDITDCSCGKGHRQPAHTCPYKADINNDYSECVCCKRCESECSDKR